MPRVDRPDGPDSVDADLSAAGGTPASADFDAFVAAEQGRLLNLAYSLTGSRAAAEDLAQEALLRLYQRWARVAAYEQPAAWVRRVLLNLAFSRTQRLRHEARTLLRLASERERHADSASEAESFWSAIRGLPRRQAEVLVLYYAEDRGTTEIAGILQIAEGTVRALLHQGRQGVRDRLAQNGTEEGTS
jgi:RNA polymerase sigma-70 factor (ECF subfamily)